MIFDDEDELPLVCPACKQHISLCLCIVSNGQVHSLDPDGTYFGTTKSREYRGANPRVTTEDEVK